jgi:hypothetical protein
MTIDREPHKCSFCGEMSWQCEAVLGGGAICISCANTPRMSQEEFSEFVKWLDDKTIKQLKSAAEKICRESKT